MTNLTKSTVSWDWSPSCQAAFDYVKHWLTHTPTMVMADYGMPFEMNTNASTFRELRFSGNSSNRDIPEIAEFAQHVINPKSLDGSTRSPVFRYSALLRSAPVISGCRILHAQPIWADTTRSPTKPRKRELADLQSTANDLLTQGRLNQFNPHVPTDCPYPVLCTRYHRQSGKSKQQTSKSLLTQIRAYHQRLLSIGHQPRCPPESTGTHR